jgi:hypothetical protein
MPVDFDIYFIVIKSLNPDGLTGLDVNLNASRQVRQLFAVNRLGRLSGSSQRQSPERQ